MNTKTFTLPEYWASYLINGDHSGLDEKEKKEVDKFLAENPRLSCVDSSEEAWYQSRNDWGTIGGNVVEYTFLES